MELSAIFVIILLIITGMGFGVLHLVKTRWLWLPILGSLNYTLLSLTGESETLSVSVGYLL